MSTMKITATVTKTIQEKQFEPLVISVSGEMTIDVADQEDEFYSLLDSLEAIVTNKFEQRGLKA